ncbi:HTH domain-containing protein [Photobacterium sanguinicancri]|uniref:Helix-turn-helix type 11 domain-containing protein n=1 Tax=Photobacterium sanguinicancri TaxID=875932 RepID=A0ABX4FSN8_9GAMM|nr:HTH domain-containing protein [Photobacterium sanguinicancri]OZS41879.1 hypothetical protein ASV53_21355 [Photobacterium sanguinicancri]
MSLNDKHVLKAIELLKSSNNFNISMLADHLGISRQTVYKNYGHLLPKKNNDTEDKIITAIKSLEIRTNRKNHSIQEVATEAGITRQAISRNYKHLIPYIKGEYNLEHDSPVIELRQKLELAEAKIKEIELNNEENFGSFKNRVFSQMMKADADSLKGHDLRAVTSSMQIQNDSITDQNKQMLSEISELNTEISRLKRERHEHPSGCNVILHLKPTYDAINSDMNTEDIIRLMHEAEEINIGKAIAVCDASNPDAIIFFQPFLSCSFKECHLPTAGKIVVIESNFPTPMLFKKLLSEISDSPVHSISSRGQNVELMKYFCRKYHQNKFNDDVIEKILTLIYYPSIEDGFKSITQLKPDLNIKLVK